MGKTFYILSLVLLLAGCKEFSFPSFHNDEELLAKVGNKELYMDDVKNIYSEAMSKDDSISILKAHVERWVQKEIKILEAEKLFTGDQNDIKKLIENYQNTLLVYKYEEFLSGNVDTVVAMAEILEYYAHNRDMFRLTSPVVKAKVLTLPKDFRSEKKIKELFVSTKPESLFDLSDMISKNNLKIEDYTSTWFYFNDVLKHIPFPNKSTNDFLKENSYYEIEDSRNKYMMVIENYRVSGSYTPIEMVETAIRKTINNTRRANYINEKCDSAYRDMEQQNKITIKKF